MINMGSCIFCDIINGTSTATVVDEDEYTITILDIKPLFPGHCLVMPKKHIVTLPELNDELLELLFRKTRKLAAILPEAMNAQGTFVAMNNIVSQSVPHLHVHVVPRTKGDGLKGFFWPRKNYKNEEHKNQVAGLIRASLNKDIQ